ncbi:MAG TPA: hypothetical protein VF469_27800 [Kofleriaceae bacterium]
MKNTVTVRIGAADGMPAHQVINIPWYAGMRALDAMIIADAITESAGHCGTPEYQPELDFSFRATFSSMYGAFVDQIAGVEGHDGMYWLLYIYLEGQAPWLSARGVSEALLIADMAGLNVVVEWLYETPPASLPTSSADTAV